MNLADCFPSAAQDVIAVVKGVDTGDLDRPTPCTDFELRALVNHFVGTTAALTRVAARQPLDPDDPYGSTKDPVSGDWQSELSGNLQQLAAAWADVDAWAGTVDMGGGPMPATMIAEMSLAEMLLHGWDLARATGQELTVPEDVAAELRRSIEETAELGRSMGAYGDAVAVSEAEPEFARALGASGRDPRWPDR